MSGKKKLCIVVGAGQMGQVEARAWKKLGYKIGIIDVKQQDEILSEFEAEWLGDGMSGIAVDPHKSYLASAWNISCPTDLHYFYSDFALEMGAKKILLEKPSTSTLEETADLLSRSGKVLIQVNYVERAQPVVKAAIEWMQKNHFRPADLIFRRSHDMRERVLLPTSPDDLKWITFRDLCHDISELELILQNTWWRDQKGSLNQLDIGDGKMVSWQEKYDSEFPFGADVESDFILVGENADFMARIYGANDSPLHRYFVATDQEQKQAVWVNTLPRQNQGIFPFAALVPVEINKSLGQESVRKLLKVAESEQGLPNTFDDTVGLLRELGGGFIGCDFKPSPADIMIKNLHEARSEQDLICSLETAFQIERLVHKAYQAAGVKLPKFRSPS